MSIEDRSGAEHVLVGALIVRRTHEPSSPEPAAVQILLGKRTIRRALAPGVWDLLGGHCEPGEAPEQALVRELEEEAGITPTAWRPLGTFAVPPDGDTPALTLHVYEVTAWTGTPHNRQPHEHTEISWFPLEDACRLQLAHPSYAALFRRLEAEV